MPGRCQRRGQESPIPRSASHRQGVKAKPAIKSVVACGPGPDEAVISGTKSDGVGTISAGDDVVAATGIDGIGAGGRRRCAFLDDRGRDVSRFDELIEAGAVNVAIGVSFGG